MSSFERISSPPKPSREKAILDLKAMRQTHEQWLEHVGPGLSKADGAPHYMRCAKCEAEGIDKIVGDAAHQLDCIAKYDNALAVLEAFGDDQPSQGGGS